MGTAEWEHADVEAALFALAEWPVATRPENYRCAMTDAPPGHARARVVDVGAMSVVHASLGCVNLALCGSAVQLGAGGDLGLDHRNREDMCGGFSSSARNE